MVGDMIEADNMEVGTGSTYFNNESDMAMVLIKHGAFEGTDKNGDLEIMTQMMGYLSHDHFFKDFEDHIEWGGYDYDHEYEDDLDGHGVVVWLLCSGNDGISHVTIVVFYWKFIRALHIT